MSLHRQRKTPKTPKNTLLRIKTICIDYKSEILWKARILIYWTLMTHCAYLKLNKKYIYQNFRLPFCNCMPHCAIFPEKRERSWPGNGNGKEEMRNESALRTRAFFGLKLQRLSRRSRRSLVFFCFLYLLLSWKFQFNQLQLAGRAIKSMSDKHRRMQIN